MATMMMYSTLMPDLTNPTDYYDVIGDVNVTSNETTTIMAESAGDDDGAIYFEVLIILATYFYPLVVIGGVLFNSLSLAVLLTPNMVNKSISVYLSALAVTDSLVLVLDFINNYFKEVLGIYAIGVNDFLCTLYRFSFDVFFTLSAWIVVAISVERFIVVWFPLKGRIVTSVKKAKFTVLFLFMAIVVYKLYNFWVWEVVEGKCDWKKGFEFFQTYVNMPLTFAAYSYVPLVILLISNFAIIVKLRITLKNRASLTSDNDTINDHETNKITITVLMISFAYMVLTVPLSAYYTIQYADHQFIEQTPQMAMGEMIILLVGLSNHGINFFLYILSSKNFRKSLMQTLHLDKLISTTDSNKSKPDNERSENSSKAYGNNSKTDSGACTGSSSNISMTTLSKSSSLYASSNSPGLNISSVSVNVMEPQVEVIP